MYERFYGFKEKPFQIVPSPSYLYKSETHQNALTYLEYGLFEHAGFILLTGEVGSGKTTLIQYILTQLGNQMIPGVIFNTQVSANELLRLILSQFELNPTGDKAQNLETLNEFLINTYASRKQALLVIDEAQNLAPEALEEVRMLSNLQTAEHTLLQVMLVGQPELNIKLSDPSLRQVAQRIAVRYHLTGLSRKDTGRYIEYRLERAGGKPDLFTEAAIDLIYRISSGMPRSINIACQAALVYGFADEAKMISQDIIKQIMGDKLGIGFETAKQTTEKENLAQPGDSNSSTSKNNGYKERLDSIEQIIKGLQGTVENRLGVIEKGISSQQSETIQNLTRLLQQEREWNQDLVRKNAQLDLQYRHLKQLVEKCEEEGPEEESLMDVKRTQ